MPDIEDVLNELKGKIIIVEGKKDLKALQELGITRVVPINSRPLITIVQGLELFKLEVVILTDFDKQGRKLNARLTTLLQKYKIRNNLRLRHMMRALGKTRIEDFQRYENGIDRSVKKEGDIYGEISANVNKVHYQRKNKGKRSH